MNDARIERRLAAILAADIAGYSRLMAADEEGTLARLTALRRDIVDPTIAEHRGRVVKTTGDGLLAEFASVVDAVAAAVRMQQAVAAEQAALPGDERLAWRVGINLGDIMLQAGDIFGDGVNLAARLEALAEPGGILVAGVVVEQVRDKLDVRFEDQGERTVKNLPRPVRVYRVAAQGGARRKLARRRLGWLMPFAVICGLAVAIAAWFGAAALRGVLPSSAGKTPQLSIAVLPFANLSGDPSQENFVDGITDDLIADLSRISGAFVISRNTSFTYKGKSQDARNVGHELGVRYVLEGSVRHVGEQVRVNAQLVEAETGAQIWSERFDLAVADAYALQDQVTGRIARALNVELKEAVSRQVARGKPDQAEAAALATHAWAILFNKPQTRETNEEARPILDRAIALDPRSAEAWTGLSYMHNRAALYGWSESRAESRRLALEAGERALSLDPRSADAHYVLGFAAHQLSDFTRARRLFHRCLELNPNYAPAYFWLGVAEIFEGNASAAPSLIERAFRLSPRDGLASVWHAWAGMAQLILGNNELAISESRRGVAENANQPNSYAVLAAALAHTGQVSAAQEALRRYISLTGRATIAEFVRGQRPSEAVYRERFAPLIAGLRKAGMPESR
jgi:adenylate cyclase